MKPLKQRIVLSLILAGNLLATPMYVSARTEITVDVAPPALRREAEPKPRAGSTWAPGHWQWSGHFYSWVAGTWITERPGYHWVADQWEPVGDRWHYVAGHWER